MRGSLGDELLRTHVLYLPLIRKVRAELKIKGIAHITGGGLIDNIPRVLPEDVNAEIQLGTWPVSPLFQLLANAARIKNEELHQVFNMGIGMVFIVAAKDAEKALKLTRGKLIGQIVKGERKVVLEGSSQEVGEEVVEGALAQEVPHSRVRHPERSRRISSVPLFQWVERGQQSCQDKCVRKWCLGTRRRN